MYTVVEEVHIMDKYDVLLLDRQITDRHYTKVVIDKTEYPIVPSYDINGIAIESTENFVGKNLRLA